MKQFLKAMLIRAIKTFCQTAVALIAVGATIAETDWLYVLSVSAVAFVMSCLTSVATGLPEAPFETEDKGE